MKLKEETKIYYDLLRSRGVDLIKFNCPCCNAVLETEKNYTSSDWDTLSICPECEKGFMKITPFNSREVIARAFKR